MSVVVIKAPLRRIDEYEQVRMINGWTVRVERKEAKRASEKSIQSAADERARFRFALEIEPIKDEHWATVWLMSVLTFRDGWLRVLTVRGSVDERDEFTEKDDLFEHMFEEAKKVLAPPPGERLV